MSRSLAQMLQIVRAVSHGLQVGRGQTIVEAAQRVCRDALPGPAKDAAETLLHGSGDIWDRMEKAAKQLKPRLVRTEGT